MHRARLGRRTGVSPVYNIYNPGRIKLIEGNIEKIVKTGLKEGRK